MLGCRLDSHTIKGFKMCGIFGAIGRRINVGVVRALAIANRDRGLDSLGFFGSSGKMRKMSGDPIDCLSDKGIADFIDSACSKGWFIVGHTRHATQGNINGRNAHPFRYGRIVGVHNGIVTAPQEYEVDSQYLIDSLNKFDGNYQAALGNISGYWSLAWFNGAELYLQAHSNTIAMGVDKSGTIYFSSDVSHLNACVRIVRDFRILGAGDTISVDCKHRKPIDRERFISTVVRKPVTETSYTGTWWKSKKQRKAERKLKEYGFNDGTIRSDPFYVEEERDRWARDWDCYTREYE